MANAHNNFKPRRSRRSGIKKMKLIKSNLAVLKKYLAIFVLVLLASCATPVKIIETYTTDSTGKTVKVVQKIYDNTPSVHVVPDASLNVITSPLWYSPWYRPYYPPRIIYIPRPNFGPLPPSPRPRH